MRRTAGAAHHDAFGLDDLARIGRSVLLVLETAARIAFARERAGIGLLLVRAVLLATPEPAPEPEPGVPAPRLH